MGLIYYLFSKSDADILTRAVRLLKYALTCIGMPDDCTVIVAHVVGKSVDEVTKYTDHQVLKHR